MIKHGIIGRPLKNQIQSGLGKSRAAAQNTVSISPVKGLSPEPCTRVVGLDLLGHNVPAPELTTIPISLIEIGDQILPADTSTVEALKEVFSIDRQVLPVPIRKLRDGRYELISGYAEICALRALNLANVLALVVSDLSDLDARFLQIANSIHPKLSVLDRALLHARLRGVLQEKAASQHETSSGADPTFSIRKMAEHLGSKKDAVLRWRKIARIHPEVHAHIRELHFENNQKALIDIADAGETAAGQIAKLKELADRAQQSQKGRKSKTQASAATPEADHQGGKKADIGSIHAMPDIPEFLRRDKANVSYDYVKKSWPLFWHLVLALDANDRKRIIDECILSVIPTHHFQLNGSHEACDDR